MAEQKKRKTVGDVIRMLLMLAALCVFCYSAYQLLTIYLEYKKGTDEYTALEQYVSEETEPSVSEGMTETSTSDGSVPTMKNPIDFNGLQKINDEVIGWIQVKALDISYPVAQAADNDFYLSHTFEKASNSAGCIFIDYQNERDFSDRNTVIYGHNMKNGSMFGNLKDFYREEVYEKSPYIWIYTPEEIYKYEIFSCQEVGAVSATYQMSFQNDKEFLEYIEEGRRSSAIQSDLKVEADDSVITLSTCTGNDATRFIVQAKRIKIFQSK